MKEHLKKLMAQRKAKYEKMQALLNLAKKEERSFTEDEQKEYDSLDKEYDSLSADIERTEKQIKRDEELNRTQKPPLVGAGEKKERNPNDIPVDKQRYSLMRAINAMVTGNWEKAKYEREISLQIADNLGKEARGLFVPLTIQRDIMATKPGTGLSDAGALVGTDHRDDLFIDSLKASSFVVANGAHVITRLVENLDIPRSLGGITFTWVDENGEGSESAMNLDSVAMKPKTITGSVPITRRLIKQSSPAVEELILNDIKSGIALSIDKAVLRGAGGVEPTGILNTTGVNTVTIADTDKGVPTFAEAVAFETALADDNALVDNAIYVTTPAINGAMKTTPIDSGSGIMLNTNNMVNGYKAIGTTLMPSKKVLFGNFGDVIIGMWGTMDIVADTATMASKGGVVLRVFQDIDIAIRHPQSFAVSA